MSTKTTLKRIALVAVAATGIGVLSVAPSFAAPGTHQADTLTLVSSTSTATIGSPVTAVVNQSFIAAGTEGLTVTASLVSAPAGSSVLPALTNVGGTDVLLGGSRGGGGGSLQTVTTAGGAGYVTGFTTATLTPSHAGTYVIKLAPGVGTSTGVLQATAITWTVVVAAVPAITAANSATVIKATTTIAGVYTDADATIAAAKLANTTAGQQVATIRAFSRNSVPTDLSTTTTLSAAISGPGTLGFGTNIGGADPVVGSIASQGRAITGQIGGNLIGVFSDGTAGTATITISAGTLVLGTETVVFYGSVAKIVATVVNPVIATTNVGLSATGAITAVATDANGNAVANASLYITSSDLTVLNASYKFSNAITDSTGKATFDLCTGGCAPGTSLGLKAGTVNLVVGNGTDAPTTTVSAAAVSVRVGSETANSVTMAFDKSTYVLGEKATLTITVLDAAGLPVANNAFANLFAAAPAPNFSFGGGSDPLTVGVTTTGSTGTKTYTVFMPSYAADVVVTATGDTSLPAAARVLYTSTTASVTNSSSDAATDAANAATDAANYAADAADAATTAAEEATAAANDAADAAQAAQDSADAATAAVVELSTKVSALIDSLRAQITGLGAYVAKVAAALGRVGTALNKVLAKK
jgi:hypothetical protein